MSVSPRTAHGPGGAPNRSRTPTAPGPHTAPKKQHRSTPARNERNHGNAPQPTRRAPEQDGGAAAPRRVTEAIAGARHLAPKNAIRQGHSSPPGAKGWQSRGAIEGHETGAIKANVTG